MPRTRLLARTIQAIKPPPSGRVEYWDTDLIGFGLRVSDSGRKTWIAMYRHTGRLRRLTLGTYPILSLADARTMALGALRDAAHGKDPAGEKRAARKSDTFGDLADQYMERHAKVKKRSWRKDQQALDRDLLPRLRHRKAGEVSRRDVRDLLDEIADRGAPIQANRTLEIIRRVFNWGIAQDIVATNPCAGIEKPSAEQRRERVLTDDEIRAVWKAFGRESPRMGRMFKLRLITAQRGGEVTHMRWQDIDLASGWWTIPGEHSKNGLAHRVWLSEAAREILAELAPKSDGGDWVFPSPTSDGPIQNVWKATARIRDRSGVDFRPHDLRRTAATRLTGDLGIPRLVVSKILNHAESGVTSTYDRASYDQDKRRALDAWGAQLAGIIEDRPAESNVVTLAHG